MEACNESMSLILEVILPRSSSTPELLFFTLTEGGGEERGGAMTALEGQLIRSATFLGVTDIYFCPQAPIVPFQSPSEVGRFGR